MRAACVIILASLTVFMSPGIQCQTLPGEGDPSLDELLQLLRSMLTQMEDENHANGVCSHSQSLTARLQAPSSSHNT